MPTLNSLATIASTITAFAAAIAIIAYVVGVLIVSVY